jgi:hypothetical protein
VEVCNAILKSPCENFSKILFFTENLVILLEKETTTGVKEFAARVLKKAKCTLFFISALLAPYRSILPSSLPSSLPFPSLLHVSTRSSFSGHPSVRFNEKLV